MSGVRQSALVSFVCEVETYVGGYRVLSGTNTDYDRRIMSMVVICPTRDEVMAHLTKELERKIAADVPAEPLAPPAGASA